MELIVSPLPTFHQGRTMNEDNRTFISELI